MCGCQLFVTAVFGVARKRSCSFVSFAKGVFKMKSRNWKGIAYWLVFGALVAGLAYGVHQYFEYRNRELDRRLEQLR